jgi:hypothetical protein
MRKVLVLGYLGNAAVSARLEAIDADELRRGQTWEPLALGS